ncbi:MAG TPA: hypothetical protein VNA57_14235 [Acidimicrobiales bacterium]|nr:hypothetical protein [Acidimicrobiales bacterium]
MATTDRYVLIGLARARSSWFHSVAQWANAGTLPAEFVKCVSAEELRARLGSGRPFSALLVDASLPGFDRDLVDVARGAGCVVVAVGRPGSGTRDVMALGAVAMLPEYFDPKALLDVLTSHASLIARGESLPGQLAEEPTGRWRGQVAAVCGPGGTGTSTVAIALAQGMAADPRRARSVLLADLALHAEQAMLHDARDVVPGVQELVEAHRSGRLPPQEVRALAFDVEERGYQLLLGLRQARAWATVRPRAFEAAFESLRASYRVVVCDTDAELEGEDVGGSMDVEERHVMARTAALRADAVFAVGAPGMKGLHSLVRVLNDLHAAGVAPARIVPVINRAPKGGRARSEMTATLAALASPGGQLFGPPMFLPEAKLDKLLHDGLPLPAALTEPLAGAFGAVIHHPPPYGTEQQSDGAGAGGVRVQPGSLGSWSEEDDEEEEGGGPTGRVALG